MAMDHVLQNGVTKPIVFSIREGEFPPNGVIGAVKATDRDTDHKNNKIYYEIVGEFVECAFAAHFLKYL